MNVIRIISFLVLLNYAGAGAGFSQLPLVIDTLFLKDSTFQLSYTIGEDTISYGTVKEQMNHGTWRGFYRDGTLRFTSAYENGQINGQSTYYHPNGTVKSTTFHTSGMRSGNWKSFYNDESEQCSISWNSNGLPVLVELYGENGITVLRKKYSYEALECVITVERQYRNGSPLEKYTTYLTVSSFINHLNSEGLEYLLNNTPNFGLPITNDNEGELSGYYYRYFNNGQLWMHLEFYNGKLLEVFTQNSSTDTPVKAEFNSGNGTVIHFHHYGDTAAVINYTDGLADGNLTYFYSGNNTNVTGFMNKGTPESTWSFYSFSGKTKHTVDFKNDSVTWCIYGPKSNKYREYSLIEGVLNGSSKEFDFYDQVIAEFSYDGGFLEGQFTRWLNGNVTRFGTYHKGEQVGKWITPGLFNPISHTTRFNQKSVVSNAQLLPRFDFKLTPNIEMPRLKLAKEYSIKSYSNELKLYSETQFKTVLLELPDSDDLIGSSFMHLSIDENGNLVQLETIKSPSVKDLGYAYEFVLDEALFTTQFVRGLPDVVTRYVVVEHFRE